MSNDGQDWAAAAAAKLFGIRKLADNGTVLEEEYDTANLVAPLRAAENIPESRFDISIDPLALIPEVPTANTVWVDPANGDDVTGTAGEQTLSFATLPAALLAAKLLSPSVTNPVLISCRPGIHETAPLDMSTSSYITLAGADGCETAIIEASTATSPIITAGDGVVIKNVTLQQANGAGGIGVLMSVSGVCRIESCCMRDCTIGARSTGPNRKMDVYRTLFIRASGEVMDRALEATNGGSLVASECVLNGEPGTLIERIVAADNAIVDINDPRIAFGVSGLYAENGGAIRCQGAQITFCTNGVHIANTNGTISIATSAAFSSTTEDVLIEGGASLLIASGLGHEKDLNVQAGSQVVGTRFDSSKLLLTVEGNQSVGAAGRSGTASFGGGGIHVDGLRAWHNNNVEAGTFTDVTAAVISESGSAIDLVPGTGLGNSFFIGGILPLPGLYFDVVLAQSGGTITPKYWDGGAWQPIPRWMTTEAVPDYAPTGDALFAATGRQNMRFGGITGEAAKAVNGVTRYWYLFEVTSALTTSPQIEQARLHSHHSRKDPDGVDEFFGDARPEVYADLDLNTWASGSTPGSFGITNYSTNVRRGRRDADFPNTTAREMGYRWPIPKGFDTSYEAELIVRWKPSTTNTGAMVLQEYHVIVPPNSLLNGTLPGEVNKVATEIPSGTIDQEQTIVYPIAATSAIAGVDDLALKLLRDPTADSFTGTVELEKITLRYRAWRL